MSTIKVNKIENTATADGGVAIDVDGHVTIDGQNFPTAGPLSNRNFIINGAMTVSQRFTSNTGQTAGAYRACDRFAVEINALGTWTIEQSTEAPPGFSKSLKVDCTTADASPAAGDFIFIRYKVEAQDLQHLNFGTANAQPLTLSFWVRSNKTGDASVMLNSPDGGDRAFITTYNIAASDTWEYKTVSIPADVAGTINDDNGVGFEIEWWLDSGTTFIGTAPAAGWAARVQASRNNSNIGVGGSTADEFYLTGVQLEVGSKATSFEHRSYGDELQRCMRYYQKITNASTTNARTVSIGSFNANRAFGSIPLATDMRVEPGITFDNLRLETYSLADSYEISAITAYGELTSSMISLDCRTATNVLTANQVYMLRFDGSATVADRGHIAFDSEL